jgi:hypothetical protein
MAAAVALRAPPASPRFAEMAPCALVAESLAKAHPSLLLAAASPRTCRATHWRCCWKLCQQGHLPKLLHCLEAKRKLSKASKDPDQLLAASSFFSSWARPLRSTPQLPPTSLGTLPKLRHCHTSPSPLPPFATPLLSSAISLLLVYVPLPFLPNSFARPQVRWQRPWPPPPPQRSPHRPPRRDRKLSGRQRGRGPTPLAPCGCPAAPLQRPYPFPADP